MSWRKVFIVNLPVSRAALWLVHRHMPGHRGVAPRPLDIVGLLLFGSGAALVCWLPEAFGEHRLDALLAALDRTVLVVHMLMIGVYGKARFRPPQGRPQPAVLSD